MATADAAALLSVWDALGPLPSDPRAWDSRNAALLRAFAVPDAAEATAGGRQAMLLRLYAQTFGPRLDGLAACPACGTEVDVAVPVAELVAATPAAQPVVPFDADGCTIGWRVPDGADLAAAAACPDPDEGALLLVTRCVTQSDIDPADLSMELRTALARRVAAADPFLDITLALTCPDCESLWESPLDVGAFVATALDITARRLLREVDELARAYGWSEAQVLGLSERRRAVYLAMVRGG
jgi:hypothetical protein